MGNLIRDNQTEFRLGLVLIVLCVLLSIASDKFLTLQNFADLLNNNSVNLIWAFGLLIVLIAGGIDISFAVSASVVQYVAIQCFETMGGAGWCSGFLVAGGIGVLLGFINAALIHYFRIISIVVTIATYNAYFGLLMYFSNGRFLYDLPDWLAERIVVVGQQRVDGGWAEFTLPVFVMLAVMVLTWVLLRYSTIGRQLLAFGDNPEGARRVGINVARMQFFAFGWCGLMAGIGGLMQANIVQEVIPNALIGRELDVLAAVVLGGARLGGGKGTVLGCFLGVLLVAITQNGLNLLGISPFAFKMIIGAIILIAISTSNIKFGAFFNSASRSQA